LWDNDNLNYHLSVTKVDLLWLLFIVRRPTGADAD